MIFATVCSGIEAASVAWKPLGWRPAFFAEIDAFPSAVLAHHYPDVPNLGDMTRFQEWPDAAIDVLAGGTPCQSFSVAGLRGGLADPRGNLALTFLAIADRYRPRWVVYENVPGLLSADDGGALGSFLGGLGQLGYGWAYRVLDAQYCRVDGYPRAVPQRRRRVFVVGCLGSWASAAAVLFEPESSRGHSAPRREAGQVAPTVPSRSSAGGGLGTDFDCDGGHVSHTLNAKGGAGRIDGESETFVPVVHALPIAPALNASNPYGDHESREGLLVAHALRAGGFDASEDGTGRGTPIVPIAFDARQSDVCVYGDRAAPLDTDAFSQAIAFDPNNELAETPSDMYGVRHADAPKARSFEALRALRQAVGEKAFCQWGVGVAVRVQTTDFLRSGLHGSGVRREADDGNLVVDDASSCAQDGPDGAVLDLWRRACIGRPPQGWRPSEQLARELGSHLSLLPHQGAQAAARFLHDLREAGEGLRLLREALSTVPEVRRPVGDEGQPAHSGWAVRRLTPTEAERLQGFPDGYTAIPYRGKPAADGPRYKALGNSWAVNCARWIGRRIEAVEALRQDLSHNEAAE